MDYILFIEIIAWIGAIIFGLGTVLSIYLWYYYEMRSIYLWYYYEMTKAGQFEQLACKSRGQIITGYKFWNRFIPFVICTALLISLY